MTNIKLLDERAIELDNGKAYAVQDGVITQKTHNALGDKDIILPNQVKDPRLTSNEKEIVKQTTDKLEKIGKLGDINTEFNVSHGPDIKYYPFDSSVKITPDNGKEPYKLKIPELQEALANFKNYDYDILEEGIALLNLEEKESVEKALSSKFRITETVSGKDVKSYGYLENEAIIYKINENTDYYRTNPYIPRAKSILKDILKDVDPEDDDSIDKAAYIIDRFICAFIGESQDWIPTDVYFEDLWAHFREKERIY
ncbi:MAG: hypothetical protein HUJ68_07435 [Clostridia bacterium]|nr:hypothetical protein [Clostridia bacterium]